MKSQVDSELHAFEEQMKLLRALFERFFLGLERLPPVRDRERLTRALRTLEATPPTSTSGLFRFQALKATWISYEAYWTRRLRGREEAHSAKGPPLPQAQAAVSPKSKGTAPAQAIFPPEMLQKLQGRWHELAEKHGQGPAPSLEALQNDLRLRYREAREKYPGQKLEVKLAVSGDKTSLVVTRKA